MSSTTQRSKSVPGGYAAAAKQMEELASLATGQLGNQSERENDGYGITVPDCSDPAVIVIGQD